LGLIYIRLNQANVEKIRDLKDRLKNSKIMVNGLKKRLEE